MACLIFHVGVAAGAGAGAGAVKSGAGTSPSSPTNHWAFRPLPMGHRQPAGVSIDTLVRQKLKESRLSPAGEADRATLIRRVAFILTGLPPTPEEIATFLADRTKGAYEQVVERYLNSPRYGERWGKHWLDAAGYADSNGYFNADTDRPLAYRYRDYVIRSINHDKPFDQFVREQLAGDELAGWKPGQPATPSVIELLEATHYLRNGQDGSGESDGNPDEVRTDRYYALESAMQIIGSSLLGLTWQCAKCHDHKFEPLSQKDYYAFQAVLYPAFNIEKWVKPQDRAVHANLPGELEAWETKDKQLESELAGLKTGFKTWLATNRVAGKRLFVDPFDAPGSVSNRWSQTAPGDDAPAGAPPVALDSEQAPGAIVRDGALRIIESGGSGDRWLCTQESFNWLPASTGQWIQVTFDLVATRLSPSQSSAERFAYVIAAHDFNDNSSREGGNILIDGNPGGATTVHLDYPGADSKSRGNIGETGYKAGRNYGVRVTRTATNELILEHLVDGVVDGGVLKLRPEHLPPGGFAFEYCCGRSFIVDNLIVEQSDNDSPGWIASNDAFQKFAAERRKNLEQAIKEITGRRTPKPGRISWMTDGSPTAPAVHLLNRGNHKTPGDIVEPAFPAFLARLRSPAPAFQPERTGATTGRRLAWARWLTERASPQESLLARVTVNRVWQQYFGVGLVATPDNLGLSGARPTHPELLDELAAGFIESGWSMRALHRRVLQSATFRQSSAPRSRGLARDPEDHLLWRYPLRRLDAEAIRDAMLSISGQLGSKTNGPYVPTPRNGQGEVVVDESKSDGLARSVFLQQRRTQVPTFLGIFDAPSVVFNCTRRAATTMPLQSLSLLNSEFAMKRGEALAQRLINECGPDTDARVRRGFVLACGREPDAAERRAAQEFIRQQTQVYLAQKKGEERIWADFSQSLFGLNAFLYLE